MRGTFRFAANKAASFLSLIARFRDDARQAGISGVCFSMQPFRQTWGMPRLPDAFTQHCKPHPTPLGPEGEKERRRE